MVPLTRKLPTFTLFIIIVINFLSGCISQPVKPTPIPSSTAIPFSNTPTATIVWFPPTATATIFPTPVITPTVDLRPQVGDLIISDNFTDPAPWQLAQSSTTSVALGQEEITLALNQPGGYLFTLRDEPVLRDFYLEITASPSLCRGEDEYGLLLRVSPSPDFYRFSLSCDGQTRLDKYYQGRASSPQPFIMSGAIPPGAPSQSRLAVWLQGKEMHFYANSERLFSVSDPSITAGTLGMFIRSAGENAVTVSFSELEIYTADAGPALLEENPQ